MKKSILTVMLLAVTFALTAQTKKVAVMETKTDQIVTEFQSKIIRGSMEVALASASDYDAYDRTAFDIIMKEHAFERSGAVEEKQIRELGKLAAVQYILVTEASKDDLNLYILAKMLDVETGQCIKIADGLCYASPIDIKEACDKLSLQLFGKSISMKSKNNETQASKKPLPPKSIDERMDPVAIYYFDYNSDSLSATRMNPAANNAILDLMREYSIKGFIIGGTVAPDEDVTQFNSRSEAVLKLLKTELKSAGYKEDDYEFVTEEYGGINMDLFMEILSYSAVTDKEQVLRILNNKMTDRERKQELQHIHWLYPEIGKDIFPLCRRVEVYVY